MEMSVFEEVELKAVTEKALLCEIDGKEVWIPKSQVGSNTENLDDVGDIGTLEIPTWLAGKKGLST